MMKWYLHMSRSRECIARKLASISFDNSEEKQRNIGSRNEARVQCKWAEDSRYFCYANFAVILRELFAK